MLDTQFSSIEFFRSLYGIETDPATESAELEDNQDSNNNNNNNKDLVDAGLPALIGEYYCIPQSLFLGDSLGDLDLLELLPSGIRRAAKNLISKALVGLDPASAEYKIAYKNSWLQAVAKNYDDLSKILASYLVDGDFYHFSSPLKPGTYPYNTDKFSYLLESHTPKYAYVTPEYLSLVTSALIYRSEIRAELAPKLDQAQTDFEREVLKSEYNQNLSKFYEGYLECLQETYKDRIKDLEHIKYRHSAFQKQSKAVQKQRHALTLQEARDFFGGTQYLQLGRRGNHYSHYLLLLPCGYKGDRRFGKITLVSRGLTWDVGYLEIHPKYRVICYSPIPNAFYDGHYGYVERTLRSYGIPIYRSNGEVRGGILKNSFTHPDTGEKIVKVGIHICQPNHPLYSKLCSLLKVEISVNKRAKTLNDTSKGFQVADKRLPKVRIETRIQHRKYSSELSEFPITKDELDAEAKRLNRRFKKTK